MFIRLVRGTSKKTLNSYLSRYGTLVPHTYNPNLTFLPYTQEELPSFPNQEPQYYMEELPSFPNQEPQYYLEEPQYYMEELPSFPNQEPQYYMDPSTGKPYYLDPSGQAYYVEFSSEEEPLTYDPTSSYLPYPQEDLPLEEVKRVNKKFKSEDECRVVLERLFHQPFPSVRPAFLINPKTKRRLECDMFNEKLRLCVERNGEQHYEYTPFFHKNQDKFEEQLYRDDVKRKLLEEHGYRLLTIPYSVKREDLEEYIIYNLSRYGIYDKYIKK